MGNDTQAVSDDFRRARRNLMVLSVLIIVLKLGGIGISELAFLGTKFSIENYSAIYAVMWLVFGYFAWRYFQRIATESDLGIVHDYLSRLSGLTFHAMRENAFKTFPEAGKNCSGEFNIAQLTKVGMFKRNANVVVGQNTYGDQDVENYTLNLLSLWLWPYHIRTLLYVLFVGNLFTEHLLPPILAIVAILVGFSGWEGSVVNVIKAVRS